MKIKTALISVSDKNDIDEFGKALQELGISIISTGKTAEKLINSGVHISRIEELTKIPELLDGRVKTLHPYVHAGILARKDKKEHLEQLEKLGIKPIDLVVVNLYPFKDTIANKESTFEERIENIDIGGVALIRAAAKNHESVAVVVDKTDYAKISGELKKNDSQLSKETLRYLARKAFEETAAYESLISNYFRSQFFSKTPFSDKFSLTFEKLQECRYGENPHQRAAFYKEPIINEPCIATAIQVHGKEMSFNNINDANGAVELLKEFSDPACVIVKHANPCGVAVAEKLSTAFENAYACDSTSAFGGIIALNRECDLETAKKITAFFNEIVIAPSYKDDALEELKTKKNLRILVVAGLGKVYFEKTFDLKKVTGGLLIQDRDLEAIEENQLKTVTEKKPTKNEINQLLFAFTVAKHVKSNTIVLAKNNATVGIGAGQMSRIDAAEIAIKKAGDKAKGSVLASDAFFPFRDCVDLAAKAGITAIIQPGGSLRDEDSIKAANESGIAMAFTGMRHFRH